MVAQVLADLLDRPFTDVEVLVGDQLGMCAVSQGIVRNDERADDERGAGSPAGARFPLLLERQYHARNDSYNIARPQACPQSYTRSVTRVRIEGQR